MTMHTNDRERNHQLRMNFLAPTSWFGYGLLFYTEASKWTPNQITISPPIKIQTHLAKPSLIIKMQRVKDKQYSSDQTVIIKSIHQQQSLFTHTSNTQEVCVFEQASRQIEWIIITKLPCPLNEDITNGLHVTKPYAWLRLRFNKYLGMV